MSASETMLSGLPTDEELIARSVELSSGSPVVQPFVLEQLRRHRESLRLLLGSQDARGLALHLADLFAVLHGEKRG